jgi:Protein of unknown function (DUF2480)
MNETEEIIINKVANSGLVTLDLEDIYPTGNRVVYDLKNNLFMGMILRERDFREFVKTHDWSQYKNKYVAITCTEEVIIPTWAYMLLTTKLQPFAQKIVFGNLEALEANIFDEAISKINIEDYRDSRVVVKGCSKVPVPASAYVHITNLLMPVAQSIMFGEPCSTVPLYKRPKVL